MLYSLAALSTMALNAPTYQVLAVDPHCAFIGTLGHTVSYTVQLERGGHTILVNLPSHSGAIDAPLRAPRPGDRVAFDSIGFRVIRQ